MKDKIYKLNRPKGFYILKRALIAFTSAFICSVCVAVPLSILIYTQTSVVSESENINKSNKIETSETTTEEENENNDLIFQN